MSIEPSHMIGHSIVGLSGYPDYPQRNYQSYELLLLCARNLLAPVVHLGFHLQGVGALPSKGMMDWDSPWSFNSLRPSDAIWRQWSWTTLAQVMACCLTAPSHYLNQCWLIIRGVLWHTSESSFAGIAQGIDSGYEFEKDILKNIFKSPRGQWVKRVYLVYQGLIIHLCGVW